MDEAFCEHFWSFPFVFNPLVINHPQFFSFSLLHFSVLSSSVVLLFHFSSLFRHMGSYRFSAKDNLPDGGASIADHRHDGGGFPSYPIVHFVKQSGDRLTDLFASAILIQDVQELCNARSTCLQDTAKGSWLKWWSRCMHCKRFVVSFQIDKHTIYWLFWNGWV